MPRKIDPSSCIGCGKCQRVCLIGCIEKGTDKKNDFAAFLSQTKLRVRKESFLDASCRSFGQDAGMENFPYNKRSISYSACVDCGACQLTCPKKCITAVQ